MRDLGIKVIWFSKERYLPGEELKLHSHLFFHYIYVLNGSARISIGDQSFEARKDEFFLTPFGVTHGLDKIDRKGIDVIEIKFHVSDPELYLLVKELSGKFSVLDQQIRRNLDHLIGEGIKKEAFYGEMVHLKFLEVLLYLLRGGNARVSGKSRIRDIDERIDEPMSGVSDFNEIMLYIEKNLNEPIDLDRLAKICQMSKYHFCRKFKLVFGISPIRYLNGKRLSRAKQYMLDFDLNITQIANHVGFSDVHYFSKFFKKHEQITPQEYIKRMKTNLYFHLEQLEN